jgi:putative ABC transport system ATP-binding protein
MIFWISKHINNELTDFRRNDIGFVFQFYNLIPNLTAYENVDMAVRLNEGSISASEAMDAVGLSERRNNFPAQMSGGELQRVSIARALCKNPKLMLCDEPTGALDSVTGKRILTLLHSTSKKYNKTVVVVTHNALLAPVADRVLKLKDGKLEQCIDNPCPLSIEEVEW